MNNHNRIKITNFLNNLDIDSLAYATHFCKRKPKKISPLHFLISFYSMMLDKKFSLRLWASSFNILSNQTISFQALAKKLQFRQLEFTQALLSKALLQKFKLSTNFCVNAIFQKFERVLLEDSSCVKLANALYDSFPGSRTAYSSSAIARIQLLMDIKTNTYQSFHLTSFTKNDLSFAGQILNFIKSNDLIIRDLGYFINKVLKQIDEKSAYFLSRLNLGILIFNPLTFKQMDLAKKLKSLEINGIDHLDIEVQIGSKEKHKVRLVAFKLNKEQSKVRLNQAIQNRHKSCKISEKSLYLLTWNIFITNVKQEEWSTSQVYQAYTFRWHIEMTFKNWKSYFKIDEFIQSCTGPNPARPEIILNLCLTFMVLVFIPKFNHYYDLVLKFYNKHLSPFKFTDFIQNNLSLIFEVNQKKTLELLSRYYCYDLRLDRKNYFEKLCAMN